jgi:YceI-like protein
MGRLLQITLIAGLSVGLAGCPRPVRLPPIEPPAAPAPDLRGAAIYQVESQSCDVHILVYRGGTLARLGHNHVMTARDVGGRVWLHPQFERSGFELSFPVNALIVDDPASRRAAGSAFPADIPQADKDATRRNMLRAEVLDAEAYPEITLAAARVAGTLAAPELAVRITIKDVSQEVQVPVALDAEGNRLIARGEFDILQTQFGIAPFSVALGALQVQDRLHVRFKIVALRAS